MGVYCTDRQTGEVLGLPRRLWQLTGAVLAALGADHLTAFRTDGYVPSRVAHSWAQCLFADLDRLVVVARPVRRPAELRPVAVYRRGAPAGLRWSRTGEQLSAYDLPCAAVLLRYASFCAAGSGHVTTTLRPPAPGSAWSPPAARELQVRSGLYATAR